MAESEGTGQDAAAAGEEKAPPPASSCRTYKEDRSASVCMFHIFITMVLTGERPKEFTQKCQKPKKKAERDAKRARAVLRRIARNR
jgi:hypothetical protein